MTGELSRYDLTISLYDLRAELQEEMTESVSLWEDSEERSVDLPVVQTFVQKVCMARGIATGISAIFRLR